ncbi:MAG: hypothetical protein N2Z60_07805 [Elusimicrobiales bacterium]|nr:hypothetical protein [Elusimicrobiales bacterium]
MEINPDISIEELIENCPKSIEVFQKHSIPVFVCGEPVWDSLKGVCEKNSKSLDLILKEIKEICGKNI